jgi:hypothetical protein
MKPKKTWRILGYKPFKKGTVIQLNKDVEYSTSGGWRALIIPKGTTCLIHKLPNIPHETYPYEARIITDDVALKGRSVYLDERAFVDHT